MYIYIADRVQVLASLGHWVRLTQKAKSHSINKLSLFQSMKNRTKMN
jgi:hypothetical protein